MLASSAPAAGRFVGPLLHLAAIRREMAHDRPLYAIVGVYLLAACLLASALGTLPLLTPFAYVPFWLGGIANGALIYVVWELSRVIRAGSRRPLIEALGQATGDALPRLAAGAVLLCAVAVFYGTFTSVKTMLPALVPFWSDRALADLDAALHGGTDPWLFLSPLLGSPTATRAVEIAYAGLWGVVLLFGTVVVAMHPRLAPLRRRFYVTYFSTWIVLGNVVAAIGMSAGPVYFGHVTGDHARFAGVIEALASHKGLLHSAADIQAYLWTSFEAGRADLGSGISAFPSLHVAMATLFLIVGWRVDRRIGALLAAFWLVILAGSVHLGWHYAVDGYASILATMLIWHLAGLGQPRPERTT